MNPDLLPQAAATFFDWLWRTSCQATVAIVLVLALQLLLRKVLSPAWRHALWLLVVARLLLPWTPESAFSVFNVFDPSPAGPAHERALAGGATTAWLNGAGEEGTTTEGYGPASATKTGGMWRRWVSWLPWVWLAGAAGLPICLVVVNWRLGRQVRRERPVTDQRGLDLLEDCKQEMSVRTPLSVVETPAVGSPSLFGFVRPRLLLPAGFTQRFSNAELRYLFLHELAHVKRGDVPMNWLAMVPLVLHWFNPLVWYSLRRMRADGELACDALALSRAREAASRPYGETLIKLVESFSRPALGPGMVGILENNNQMKERIRMIAQFKKTGRWPVAAMVAVTGLALVTFTDAQSQQAATGAAARDQGPPRIVSTSPQVGATEIDPGTTEIIVTFDRDMAGGMSWTGGGPQFPKSPEGKKAQWRDKRTCVLPVKLEAAKYYRVGINSTSFQNFRSAAGVPAQPSAVYFATRGASEELKRLVSKPQIVELTPRNGAQDVDPATTELRVTFNVPMGEGCSWTGGGPSFPTIPNGKKVSWTEDKKTCVLPVSLQPNHGYRLGLNSPSHKNFQSEGGVPLDPVSYSFKTRP